MNHPEDDEVAETPPNRERVLQRAWVLSCVTCRAFLENFEDELQSATLHSRVLSWIDTVFLRSEFEEAELEFVDSERGESSQQAIVNGSWRSEGLAVLAWALNRYELPAHDQMVDPVAAANALLFLSDDAHDRRNEFDLRSADELKAFSERQFAIHWRLRDFSLSPRSMDFREFARTAWFGPLDIERVALAENDLAIDGVSISKAPKDVVRRCQSIATERHQAINWLRGRGATYSNVDTST